MSVIHPNNILEEEIFVKRNLDPDCSTIGQLLYEFGDKFVLSALEDGEYSIAVDNYLQLLESLTTHFISDEHWCWFDDMYSPNYTVSRALLGQVYSIHSFWLSVWGEPERVGSRSYGDCGVRSVSGCRMPSMIPFSDLKNSKTFLERHTRL